MPGSLAITTSNLQSVQITIDGGTKPAATGHYKITRKANAASTYLQVFTTSYDSGIEDDNSGSGFGIDEIDDSATDATTYIDPSSVAEPTTSAGTMGNTYLAQAEVISYPDNAYDRDSWTVTKVIPLAASSA